ncbi:hypothetical protein ACJJIF_19545 [Microbulbifer sp. SSSA002]|uniref:hypothetical protein n=1 Tax=unclassified Microbulbifer TaxID=2619833 RepID=UPI0040399113
MKNRKPEGIGAVLYFLYYIPDVHDEKKYEALNKYICKNYNFSEMERCKKAAVWLLNEPNLNFEEILPNLRQKDEDIIFFLKKILGVFREVSKQLPGAPLT